ncbi:MAG: hypothetical protein QNJ46_11350 [Leptolyngbyaceae cyanobacterium MO_188.B28]|nr:hypothetical protein [Leptolyngbyaceae cyanobacterium MO_188.B28]
MHSGCGRGLRDPAGDGKRYRYQYQGDSIGFQSQNERRTGKRLDGGCGLTGDDGFLFASREIRLVLDVGSRCNRIDGETGRGIHRSTPVYTEIGRWQQRQLCCTPRACIYFS